MIAPLRGQGEWELTPELFGATILASIVLWFRKRHPIWVLVILVCQTLALMNIGVNGPVLGLPVAIAIFHVAVSKTSRTGWVTFSASTAVLFSAYGILYGVDLSDPYSIAFLSLPTVAIAAGKAARSKQDLLLETQARLEEAEQNRVSQTERVVAEERLRIARDLHDTIAHEIAVMRLQAELAERALSTNPPQSAESLAVIRQASKAVLEQIADLMKALRETGETNFVESLEDLTTLLGKYEKANLKVKLEQFGRLDDIPTEVDKVAFRIVQEGLTNASKHSSDKTVHLTVGIRDEQVQIKITNSARGVETNQVKSGFGLVGLRERVHLVGGKLHVESNREGTFELSAVLPLRLQSRQ
jgi:signal transduction histidine kinase